MDYDKLLNISVELGCQLMSSGAEIYRVEESVRRLLQAYGLESPEVFAIPNCVIVSVTTPEGHPITRMRRIGSHGTNIELLERCNALCRQLCTQPPSVDKAQELLSATVKGSPKYAAWQVLMGYGIAPAFFSPLFGGGVTDALAAMTAVWPSGSVCCTGAASSVPTAFSAPPSAARWPPCCPWRWCRSGWATAWIR